MALREIEPGMIVHCRTEEEAKALIAWAYECGYKWDDRTQKEVTNFESHRKYTCYRFREDRRIFYTEKAYYEKYKKKEIIEFSNLVLTEPTLEEVLDTMHEICAEQGFCNNTCRLHDVCLICTPFRGKLYSAKALINICQQWMAEHKKKEPEKEPQIETADVCRIIEILPEGKRRCVHEKDIWPDASFGSERLAAEEILKAYCMEHEGNFIAVHEVVSRIKKK